MKQSEKLRKEPKSKNYVDSLEQVLFKMSDCRKSVGGVKTLILMKNMPQKVFNASTCGDNCAKWILNIAQNQDITINLRLNDTPKMVDHSTQYARL